MVLMHFLADQGQKVSKDKLQLWKEKVKYLGYILSQEGRHLDEIRKEATLQVPKSHTKNK